MSEEIKNDDDGMPIANPMNLTNDVREGLEDLPPSHSGKKGFKEEWDNASTSFKVLSAVALVVVLIGFFLFVFSGNAEENKPVQQTRLSVEDKLREQTQQFNNNPTNIPQYQMNEKPKIANPDEMAAPANLAPTQKANELEQISQRAVNRATPPEQRHETNYANNSAPNNNIAEEEDTGEFKPSPTLKRRMSQAYSQALDFYNSTQVVYTSGNKGVDANTDLTKSVDKEYQNLYEGANSVRNSQKFYMAAGSEIRAVLDESINTDYPSIIRSTIIYPPELSGAKALISYSLGNERITAQVQKIVMPDKGTGRPQELTVQAVVSDGLPGLGGDVNHHWGPQIASAIGNASVAGGALWYAQQNQNEGLTNAILAAPIIEGATEGVLKPLNHFGRQRPTTVKASAGQEFAIVLVAGFEVEL